MTEVKCEAIYCGYNINGICTAKKIEMEFEREWREGCRTWDTIELRASCLMITNSYFLASNPDTVVLDSRTDDPKYVDLNEHLSQLKAKSKVEETYSILSWEKPKKARSTKEHNESYVFDGGVSGGYVPNMSEEDQLKWKAQLQFKTLTYPQVKISKTFRGTNVNIFVSLKGTISKKNHDYKHRDRNTDIAISMNGTSCLSFAEFEEMRQAIEEAKEVLRKLN